MRPLSRKKSQLYSLAFFFLLLSVVVYFKLDWWPEIALVYGLPVALRQYLLNKKLDVCVTLLVSIGIFITVKAPIEWDILLPVIFISAGVYLVLKGLMIDDAVYEDEYEQDLDEEIREDHHDNV